MSNTDKTISLNITQFPQNLIIPNIDNVIKVQVINNSSKKENYKFDFEGENLKILQLTDGFEKEVEFNPGEAKNIEIKIEPIADGLGKFNINAYQVKIIEFKTKVQKVRENAPEHKFEKILESYVFNITETMEKFNPGDFIISMTKDVIKKAEQQLKKLLEQYNSLQSTGSTDPELLKDIDKYINNLAKGYLSIGNPIRALELALMLSDKNEQINLYSNLIRAYALKNLNSSLEIVNNLQDSNIQQQLYTFLALDQVSLNPEQAIQISLLMQDSSSKENLLINIFSKIIESNPLIALKLIGPVEDDLLKIKILFNIAKRLKEQEVKSELVVVLNLITEKVLKLLEINFEKKIYKIYKDILSIIAEIESPAKVHSIIENLTPSKLKEKISKDLFNKIYIMVDEIQTKIDSELIFSQFFLLNTYVSNINNEIKEFSLSGGNVSNNILAKDFNFTSLFLSLFSFDFSIFPILDRVYNDLKYSHKKSFAYYIYPSKANYNKEELRTLHISLKQFLNNLTNVSKQVTIYNLDFIPYLGKPTAIISRESELNESFYSKIKKIGDSINLIVDDSFFKGGKIVNELKQVFTSTKFRIINLVLTYEFINDYNVFKTFLQSLL